MITQSESPPECSYLHSDMKYIEVVRSIALDNKYTRWYCSLVANAIQRDICEGYIERHHVLPKSFKLGGEKDKKNLVLLTAREHFVCHWLLTKMFDSESELSKKMQQALRAMRLESKLKKQTRYTTKIVSRVYERNRVAVISALSKQVSIDNVVYESHKDAAKQTGIPNLFNKLRDERFPTYFFVDDPVKLPCAAKRDWNYRVIANGEEYSSIQAAAKQLGLTRSEIESRLKDPDNQAFICENIPLNTKPRITREQQRRKIMIDGVKFDSINAAVKTLNIHRDTLKYRLKSERFKTVYYITQ